MPRSIRLFALALSAGLIVAAFVVGGDQLSDARWLAVLGLAWVLLMVGLWVPIPIGTATERRTVIRLGTTFAAAFVVLGAQLFRMQLIRSDALANRIESGGDGQIISNPRRVGLGLAVRRGEILSADGATLAGTEEIPLGWGRTYPEPSAASVLGYYSPLQFGTAGIEQAFDRELTGVETGNPFTEVRDELLHRSRQGNDVILTIESGLQRQAATSLGGRAGAAVLIEVGTGKILAMVSNPAPDPAAIFAGSYDETETAADYWDALLERDDRPLVSRALTGLYTPGSIFKVITSAAAIEMGIATPDTVYLDDGVLNVSGRQIIENNRPDDSVIEWTLEDSLAWSLNVVYAQVGLQVTADGLRDYARGFGFDAAIPFAQPVSRSQLEGQEGFLDSPPALADTAFGQGELLVTPLHMALVAAGVANAGQLMQPQILDRIVAPDGTVIREGQTEEWRRAIRPETAETVIEMMRHAVRTGVATGAAIEGLAVGGKTGTAEIAGQQPHAWFMGFAGTWADVTPRHAVAVVLENGGSGSIAVARDILLAAADR
ncbi:MAG TPA: penicillin-binding protein 2 [Thermomicrobiales bacterium]|jgi:peptidoglycan glycosyltransferase|nr:penicillin-binding protein 2 [Thermomicrobiales bacterium]